MAEPGFPHRRFPATPLTDDQAADPAAPLPADPGHNILRERTFNPELRDLVRRVNKRDEAPSVTPSQTPDLENLDDLDSRELLVRLYRLFYQARNLIDNRDSNLSFNPFDTAMATLDDDLEGVLRRVMTECQCPEFALLVYDLSSRAFVPAINTISDLDGDNLIISLNDPLYHAITTAPEGITLDGATIFGDPFFKKKYLPAEGIEPGCWFLAVERLTAPLIAEITEAGGRPPRTMGIAPIIMVRRPLDERFDPGALTREFAVRLPVPILLLESLRSETALPEAGLAGTVIALESHLNYRMMRGEGIAVLVRCEPAEMGYFVLAYLRHRLGRELPADALFIQPMPSTLVILADESNRELIESTMLEYPMNSTTIATVTTVPIDENHRPGDIIRMILYPH